MNKKRLLKLADFLEKLPENRFDLTHYADVNFRKNDCNTTACACGWATVIFPRSGLKLKNDACSKVLVYETKEKTYYHIVAAAAFFDIPYGVAYGLFIPSAYSAWFYGGNTSAVEVAAKIRKTVEEQKNIFFKENE